MLLGIRFRMFKAFANLTNNSIIKDLYFHGPSTQKQISLTFDDAPDNVVTPQVLDVLKTFNCKATFFVIGKTAFKYPNVVERIAKEGHVIANHSWSHSKMSNLNKDQINEEVMRTENFLETIIGKHTKLFRPPYGIITLPMLIELRKMGYKTIIWSADTHDWAGISVAKIMVRVNREISQGGILLQHSASNEEIDLSNTLEALPLIIELIRSKEYSFVTIPQLLGLEEVELTSL